MRAKNFWFCWSILLSITACHVGSEISKEKVVSQTVEVRLVHTLYLDFKETFGKADRDDFLTDLKQLKDLPLIDKMIIGYAFDTGDPRLYKDYDIAVIMFFRNPENLDLYQKHPKHLALRQKYSDIFAKPPLVFDFIE